MIASKLEILKQEDETQLYVPDLEEEPKEKQVSDYLDTLPKPAETRTVHPIGTTTQPSANTTQPNGKVAQPSGTARLSANVTQLTGKVAQPSDRVTQPQPSVVVLDTIDHKTNSSGNSTQPTSWCNAP